MAATQQQQGAVRLQPKGPNHPEAARRAAAVAGSGAPTGWERGLGAEAELLGLRSCSTPEDTQLVAVGKSPPTPAQPAAGDGGIHQDAAVKVPDTPNPLEVQVR